MTLNGFLPAFMSVDNFFIYLINNFIHNVYNGGLKAAGNLYQFEMNEKVHYTLVRNSKIEEDLKIKK